MSERRKIVRQNWILWVACLLWLALTVMLSSEDGAATAGRSKRLALFIVQVFNLPRTYWLPLNQALRTAAHVVCFLILGMLLYTALVCSVRTLGRPWLWVGVTCTVIGVLDEVKKVFIPGRHLSWLEAGLNVAGAAAGIWLMSLVFQRARKRRACKRAGNGTTPETLNESK